MTIGDFATTTVDGTFRLAYLVWNTIMNLTTQDEQVACFQNVAGISNLADASSSKSWSRSSDGYRPASATSVQRDDDPSASTSTTSRTKA